MYVDADEGEDDIVDPPQSTGTITDLTVAKEVRDTGDVGSAAAKTMIFDCDEQSTATTSQASLMAEVLPASRASVQDTPPSISIVPIPPPSLHLYFTNRTSPCPRIHPCAVIRGHSLILYGGVVEVGDVEVTLDDCWYLDLNKRDRWRCLLPGTMERLVWRGTGEEDDGTEGTGEGSGDEGSEGSGGDDTEGDNDEEGDDGIEAKEEEVKEDRPSRGVRGDRHSSRVGSGGLRGEMAALRVQMGEEDTSSEGIPKGGESLREFFTRTAVYWSNEVTKQWSQGATSSSGSALGDKDVKREAFRLAECRYTELLPMLARLGELEAQQGALEEGLTTRGGSMTSTSGASRGAGGGLRR